MKQIEAMYAWNPGTGEIEVGPWPDTTKWSRGLRMTGGACFSETCDLVRLFIDFHTIVVRDRVPVDAAHKTFLAIDEYRQHISPDIEGAEEPE